MQEYYVEVGTSNYREELCRRLSDLKMAEGLPFELYELKTYAPYLVRCVYPTLKGRREEDRLTVRIYNYYFARALAEIIFEEWEHKFIKKILKKDYSFNFTEIKKIFERSWGNDLDNKPSWPDIKKKILIRAILEFLDSHQRFNIEGFMNFRADQYKRELRKQIARAVNDYSLAQEHQSFIDMLRKLLTKRTAIFHTLHLIIKPSGEIRFYDDRGKYKQGMFGDLKKVMRNI